MKKVFSFRLLLFSFSVGEIKLGFVGLDSLHFALYSVTHVVRKLPRMYDSYPGHAVHAGAGALEL